MRLRRAGMQPSRHAQLEQVAPARNLEDGADPGAPRAGQSPSQGERVQRAKADDALPAGRDGESHERSMSQAEVVHQQFDVTGHPVELFVRRLPRGPDHVAAHQEPALLRCQWVLVSGDAV